MDQQLNDYRPLCDMAECKEVQCGVPFEGYIKSRFYTIQLPVRIRPCKVHLDQLNRIAEVR
jgi:hypothetical protein